MVCRNAMLLFVRGFCFGAFSVWNWRTINLTICILRGSISVLINRASCKTVRSENPAERDYKFFAYMRVNLRQFTCSVGYRSRNSLVLQGAHRLGF